MAFENAIITKEDDEKYGLSKIYYKYNPHYETFINELRWTIDRDADCWLWKIYSFPDPDYDHGTDSKGIWILYYNGEVIEVTLDYDIDEALRPGEFHRIWKLLNLNPKQTPLLSASDIMKLLNVILKAYGYSTREQIPNYTMELQDLTNRSAQ